MSPSKYDDPTIPLSWFVRLKIAGIAVFVGLGVAFVCVQMTSKLATTILLPRFSHATASWIIAYAAFGLATVSYAVHRAGRERRRAWLHVHGARVLATCTRVVEGPPDEDGAIAWFIEAAWQHPVHGSWHWLRSAWSYADIPIEAQGRQVPALVDLADPRRHKIDLKANLGRRSSRRPSSLSDSDWLA